MKIGEVRRFALSLPGVTERPHFDKASFRVRDKIFATVPADNRHLHVLVDARERDLIVSAAPEAYERLRWGKNVVGLRVALALARPRDVKELLRSAWEQKAPKGLARSFSVTRRASK